jgi:DNA polymerase I-like protein with 3'-5' exonuclease and polymerase domains
MRDDSVGFFWADLHTGRERGTYARTIPPIPDTGWKPPETFPRLADCPILGLDVETRDTALTTKGPGFRREGDEHAHIVGISVATVDGHSWYFPMRHEMAPEQNLPVGTVLRWARDNLCTEGQVKVGANLAYDVDALWSDGVPVTGPFVDIQWAEALLDEYRRTYNLESLAQSYLGQSKVKDELQDWAVRAYGDENYRQNIYRCPPCLVGPYAEADAHLPLRIFELQRELLRAQELLPLFEKVEMPLLPQLVRMRHRGVRVDIDHAKRLDDRLSQEIERLDRELESLAGHRVDVNVKTDLQRIFDRAGIEYPRTATGQPSFAKDFLDFCDHPVAALVVDRRKMAKYRDTFVRGYVLDLHVNGRLHALFHALRGDENGTVSGRFSSSLPNLQNIPARDPLWGPLLRALFVAEYGELWLRHDWSQIEYRFLAHYARGPSGDTVRRMYRDDPSTDFHTMTQSLIRDVAGVTLDRKPVKNINFGLCYGMGKAKLSHDLGLDLAAGEELFAAYHTGVPFVAATYEAAQQKAAARGYIVTTCGRRARFPLFEPAFGEQRPALSEAEARDKYGRVRRALTHKALNRLLQGSAADLMKVAMVTMDEAGVERLLGPMLLTCHDETGHSMPDTPEGREGAAEVKRCMETCMTLRVPVIAEQSIGRNWGECK